MNQSPLKILSEIEAGAHLDFIALLAKGLLDGPVEVATGVDDEEVLDHGEGAERSRREVETFRGGQKRFKWMEAGKYARPQRKFVRQLCSQVRLGLRPGGKGGGIALYEKFPSPPPSLP